MHPVVKGELGEVSVFKHLKQQGFAIFPEMGNSSKVDLVVMDTGGHLYKVQIKCTTSTDGAATLWLKKVTLDPKYNYYYGKDDVDVYALYVEDRDIVAFVPSDVIFATKEKRKAMSLRVDPPADGVWKKNHHRIEDYRQFPTRP